MLIEPQALGTALHSCLQQAFALCVEILFDMALILKTFYGNSKNNRCVICVVGKGDGSYPVSSTLTGVCLCRAGAAQGLRIIHFKTDRVDLRIRLSVLRIIGILDEKSNFMQKPSVPSFYIRCIAS